MVKLFSRLYLENFIDRFTMKNLKLSIVSAVFLVTIAGCTPAGNSTIKPTMTAISQTIKVGQVITITMSTLTIAVTSGNFNLTPIDTGFIYSPKINQSTNEPIAPYLYEDTVLPSGSDPLLFPVDPDLEVITPITGINNVPSTVSTVRIGDQSQVTFTIKGKSVGTAILRGGFLNTTVEFPNHFKRTPFLPEYDGLISIQIVP